MQGSPRLGKIKLRVMGCIRQKRETPSWMRFSGSPHTFEEQEDIAAHDLNIAS